MRLRMLRHRSRLYLALASLPILAGCGGGGGGNSALNSGGSNPSPTRQSTLARFDVDTATGKVKITSVNDPNRSGRAILTGGAVSFTSSDLITVGGDSGKRVLSVNVANNTGEGALTNARLVVGSLSNSNLANVKSNVAVTSVAGNGIVGSANGYGATAQFNNPQGITAGRGPNQGSFFISDTSNHTIRLMSGDGTVTTFAGSAGTSGSADGTGATARFNTPQQLAVDASGNVYVADSVNNSIRRITPQGAVTTIAGTGSLGNDDGLGSVATFNTPIGIAVNTDATNIYVSENNDIRQIQYVGGGRDKADSYTVSTVAGTVTAGFTDSNPGPAAFNKPFNIAILVDQFGQETLFVADTGNNAIRRIDKPGTGFSTVSTVAGNGTAGTADGPGTSATFNQPSGITVVSVTDVNANPILFVTDSGSGLVRMITQSGNEVTQSGNYRVTTLNAGSGFADGDGTVAKFFNPVGLIAVASPGPSATLYIADQSNKRIRKMTVASGALSSNGASSAVTEPVRLLNWDAEIPNQTNQTVAWAKLLTGNTAQLQFYIPAGIAGFSFTAYIEGDTALINLPGVGSSFVTTLAGDGLPGSGNGPGRLAEFNNPASVAAFPARVQNPFSNARAFVVDLNNNRVRAVDPLGNVTTVAGSQAGYADGAGGSALFNSPLGIAAGPDGALYVTDAGNFRVRRITSVNGQINVSTVAGNGSPNTVDGRGNAASFTYPDGISVDSGGTIWVSDSSASVIRRISFLGGDASQASSYNVVTVAGTANTPGTADGTGSAARFNHPFGIFADTDGKVYVADTLNDTVRVLTHATASTVSVTTMAGSGGTAGFTDATGSSARFNLPMGVVADTAHNVYVADYSNARIRRVSPQGAVTTLAGSAGTGFADGASGKFGGPRGLTIEVGGSLLIADYNNHALRTIQRILSDGQSNAVSLP